MSDQCCQIFHALGDKTRLKILELLKGKEICVSDICTHFEMTQPSISRFFSSKERTISNPENGQSQNEVIDLVNDEDDVVSSG